MAPEHQLLAVLAAVIAFAVVSRRLTARWLTMPLVFTSLGLAIDDSRHEPVTAHPLRRRS